MSELGGGVRDVEVLGLNVRCHVDGPEEAPAVVLIHGAGADAAAVSWKRTFPALAENYRVYAPDLPGYGESDRVPEYVTPDVDFYVDALDELLEGLAVDEATVVGISKGGGIVLGYAFEHPGRVSRLVAVDSYGLGDRNPGGRSTVPLVKTPKLMEGLWWASKKSRKMTKASLANVVHESNLTEEFVDDAYRQVRRPRSGDAYIRFNRAEVGWTGPRTNYMDRMSDLPVPTLFVQGEDDQVILPEQSKRAADAAPVAELFTLAECGHWVPREQPEAFNSRLEAWLER
jgi:pimeloyl-ACP methyl ester carboxylesterase